MAFTCNISKKDRWTRVLFGIFLLIVVLVPLNKNWLIIIPLIMIVEGIVGWCGIAVLVDKFKQN